MTKPTDDIARFKPFEGRIGLNLLQYLGAFAVLGVALSLIAHYCVG